MDIGRSFRQATYTYVYPFGLPSPLPPPSKERLGGKGKGLAEMSLIGLPVPPGFIITTDACLAYRKAHREFPPGLLEEIESGLTILQGITDTQLGDIHHPLLVSVRSGARASMPGMMDTVLDLGLNDQTVVAFGKAMQNEHLAYDSYCRFIRMYADIVEGLPTQEFRELVETAQHREGVQSDYELSTDTLKQCCRDLQQLFLKLSGHAFPQDTRQQLHGAIAAVFNSWDSERASAYRRVNRIPDDWGTAVTVQMMVFGNRNERSATGVGFTRDPATGENAFYGEYLPQAQGEEVVAGRRTPQPINERQKQRTGSPLPSLEEIMPTTYQELLACVQKLEAYYLDMQDIEFTIDDGKLWMLQTRTGKRTGVAAVRIAVEMLEAGLLDERTALKRVDPELLTHLLAPIFDEKAKRQASQRGVARGLNAGPGAACGLVALSVAKALEFHRQGQPAILVREETVPDDYPGMVVAQGILTARGGSTSHAAVVARGMGKPCIVGCTGLDIDKAAGTLSAGGFTLREGDQLSIDGSTGEVFFCALPTSPSPIIQAVVMRQPEAQRSDVFRHYQKIMELSDQYRVLGVRANADTPQDAEVALAFGAEGVGLCRTEHMFLEEQRLLDVRRMLFSKSQEDRQHAVEKLLPHQKEDFKAIFRVMKGLPVTIRLLDPPLHEFLPSSERELHNLATALNMPYENLRAMHDSLKESNPMLGHRGCRLGILRPELTEIQVRAMFEAAIETIQQGIDVQLEIMVPLVGAANELVHQRALIERTAQRVFEAEGISVPYIVGTMIELPRAALIADQIAEVAEFFSFGTNDLTQTTFGISRDDGAKFVPVYVEGVPHPRYPDERLQILAQDPFQVLDEEGVGELMQIAVRRGRKGREGLKCGICGEHGGDPRSVKYCHQIYLDYVSCSPYRVPVARLAAAQAAVGG